MMNLLHGCLSDSWWDLFLFLEAEEEVSHEKRNWDVTLSVIRRFFVDLKF